MGAVRSGTLIAFGAWELPQGLEWGLGDKLTIQAPEWSLQPQGQGAQSWKALACYRALGMGDSRARTRACGSPGGKAGRETPFFPLPPAASPITGAQVVRTSVLPVLKFPVLQLSQSLQFPQSPASPFRPVFTPPGL